MEKEKFINLIKRKISKSALVLTLILIVFLPIIFAIISYSAVSPTVKLDDTTYEVLADVYATDSIAPGAQATQIKFNISAVPSTSTINSADLCLYVSSCGSGCPDNDAIFERVLNYTWEEGISASDWNAVSTDTQTTSETWNNTFAGYWHCINVTAVVEKDISGNKKNTTIRIWDSDYSFSSAGSVTDNSGLYIGKEEALSVQWIHEDRENSQFSGNTPYLIIDYTEGGDSTPPAINIIKPTNTTHSTSTLDFNVTLNENASLCQYSLDGASNVSLTKENATAWGKEVSSISEGSRNVIFTCNDTSNNWNSTNKRYFIVDTIPPEIYIIYPQNTTYTTTNITLNYTVSDLTTSVSSCWYSLNSGSNVSLPSCNNASFIGAEGSNAIQVFANDTTNNENKSVIKYFTIDTTAPVYSNNFTTPESPVTFPTGTIKFNITWDGTESSVWYFFNGTNYTNLISSSNQYEFNRTDLGAGTYEYEWYANDTFGNENKTGKLSFVVNSLDDVVDLYLNNYKNQNVSVAYPTESNATGISGNCTVVLYRDSVSKTNPEVATLGVATYNYTLTSTCSNYNYTSNTTGITYWLTVNQTAGDLGLLLNGQDANVTIVYSTESNASASANPTVILLRDGVDKTATENSKNITLEAGYYNYTAYYEDTANYSGASTISRFLNITKAQSEVALYFNGSRVNKQYQNNTYANITATLITPTSGAVSLWTNYSSGTWHKTNEGSNPIKNITLLDKTGTWLWLANFTGNNNYTSDTESWNLTVSLDTAPTVNLISPANNTNSTTRSQTFQCNITDDNQISNLTLYVWNSSLAEIHTNTTELLGTENETSFQYTLPNDGRFYWNCKGVDNASQSAFASSNNTLFIDTIFPVLYINTPTNTTYRTTNITLNYTIIESNKDSCWYSLNSTANITLASCNNITFTANHGSYYIQVFANDTSGNENKSAMKYFSVETEDAPVMSGILPADGSSTTSTSITLSVTTNENATCRYNSTDTGFENMTAMSTTNNLTHTKSLTLGVGTHTYYFRCNDTLGNFNTASNSTTFTITSPGTPATDGGGGGGGGAPPPTEKEIQEEEKKEEEEKDLIKKIILPRYVKPDSELEIKIEFEKSKIEKIEEVKITYFVRSLRDNTTKIYEEVLTKEEIVNKNYERVKRIKILEEGDYNIEIIVSYGGVKERSSKEIKVTSKIGGIFSPELIKPLIYGVGGLFVLILIFIAGKLITSKAKQKKFEKYKKIKQQIRRGERFLAVNNFVAAIETYKKLKRQFNLLKEDEKRAVYKDILDYYSKVAKKVGREQMPVIQSPMSPRIKIIRKRKKQKPKKKRGR